MRILRSMMGGGGGGGVGIVDNVIESVAASFFPNQVWPYNLFIQNSVSHQYPMCAVSRSQQRAAKLSDEMYLKWISIEFCMICELCVKFQWNQSLRTENTHTTLCRCQANETVEQSKLLNNYKITNFIGNMKPPNNYPKNLKRVCAWKKEIFNALAATCKVRFKCVIWHLQIFI